MGETGAWIFFCKLEVNAAPDILHNLGQLEKHVKCSCVERTKVLNHVKKVLFMAS